MILLKFCCRRSLTDEVVHSLLVLSQGGIFGKGANREFAVSPAAEVGSLLSGNNWTVNGLVAGVRLHLSPGHLVVQTNLHILVRGCVTCDEDGGHCGKAVLEMLELWIGLLRTVGWRHLRGL